MKRKQLTNKEGQVMTTKEGKPLVENKLEEGDIFIPVINSVIENKHEANVDGETKNIVEYKIPAKVKESDGNVIEGEGEDNVIFIKLTPTQAKKLNKIKEEGNELNRQKCIAYEYVHHDYGKCIGITNKIRREPISFDDESEIVTLT